MNLGVLDIRNAVVRPVLNAVLLTVDDRWTDGAPRFVHTFTSCHPLRDAQVNPDLNSSFLTVTVGGYEAIHSVHRTY